MTSPMLNGVPHIPPDILQQDIEGACVLNQLVAGRDIPYSVIQKLPTSPLDWFTPADRLAKIPAVENRRNALESYIENDPDHRDAIRQSLKLAEGSPCPNIPEIPKPFELGILGARELATTEFKTEWIIENILVAGQPAVIGGPKKGLKSNTMLDLSVSVASGTPFLNHSQFCVPKRLPVLMLTGESGGFATQSMLFRACEARGIELESLDGYLFIGFELPKLTVEEQVQAVITFVEEHSIKLVIIDPLYLCLTAGNVSGKPIDTSNLFDVGPLLLDISRMILKAGATPALIHHNKITGQNPYDPPELDRLAYAGIQEFARQWVLLGRRSRYVPGSGLHDLWLTAGGSAGHSGEWAVDIDEGVMEADFSGRKWNVSVRFASEAQTENREVAQAASNAKETAKEIDNQRKFRAQEEKVLEAVTKLGGMTTRSKAYEVARLSAANGRPTIARLVADRRLFEKLVAVNKGRGKTEEWGVAIPEPGQTPTNPDDTPTDGLLGFGVNPDKPTTGDPL